MAFCEYRAGSFDRALTMLRRLLLEDGGTRLGGATWGYGSDHQDLSDRALTFLEEIASRPTQRETAAALIMVGALLGD